MEEKRNFYEIIEQICGGDERYKPDSYEFVMEAIRFTQGKLKREGHVSGKELLEGIRELAINKFGTFAKPVLNHWGVTKTQDFGNIVFIMIAHKVLYGTEQDSIEDFKDVYNFDEVFKTGLPDTLTIE
ncbi:MAG: hypothetical protein PHE58_06385 [Candidatus Omnitrophica bacterium]|nr:hypothetical protein [Candidatus Omnitrophota bacterium]